MNNYPYLIAGLPELFPDFEKSSHNIDILLDHIKENIHPKEMKYLDWLLFGLKGENLSSHFYREVFKTRNRFLNEFFRFDLNMRNIQAAYIAKQSGMDAIQFLIGDNNLVNTIKTSRAADFGASEFFEESSKLLSLLSNSNILEKEQGLDLMRWNKSNQITVFNYFDIDWILGFVTRLLLTKRWDALDKKLGAELFKKLVDEVRETYKNNDKEE
ncbi:MAG: DUF2764 family protein [Bacteroidales bacterium]|jgi:hypothetical protein|nr:DUF2764 family protein [Bacteroidales bacterium]MDD3273048.1 DUF2764 family protein [Bacteroidales bacterium]MDD4058521.1 DUF2764 family protein [Bacteroidales bacterium]